jgi:large subunit ribosomal protein L10
MLKNEKKALVNNFKEELGKTNVVLLLEHKALTFSAFDQARRNAKSGTYIKKVKNNLTKIAFKGTNYEPLNQHIDKERFLILSNDLFNACQSAKFFLENQKDNSQVIAGASKDGLYDKNMIIDLASINSVQELQSKLLRAIKVVGENLVRVISKKFGQE